MATLTADRHRTYKQRSFFDQEERYVSKRAPHTPEPITPDEAERAPHAPASSPAGPTLDDLVAGTWDALTITHSAACLVCGGDLTPRWGAGPHPVAARCGHCGSEFS